MVKKILTAFAEANPHFRQAEETIEEFGKDEVEEHQQ